MSLFKFSLALLIVVSGFLTMVSDLGEMKSRHKVAGVFVLLNCNKLRKRRSGLDPRLRAAVIAGL